MARTWEQLTAEEVIVVEELANINNNSVIYKDNGGELQSVALGTSGQVLKSNGTTDAPSFQTDAGSSTSLQDAYDNGENITTDATNGAVKIQRGTASDTDNVLEILNGAGTVKAQIKGDGEISTTGTKIWLNDFELTDQGVYIRIQSFSGKILSLNPLWNNIAIGKTSADEKLDIDGNIKANTFTSGEYDAGTSGTTKTIDWDNGSTQKVEMTGNCTFTLSNPVVGATYVLKLTQDGTGTRTGTFPASVLTAGGAGITLSTASGDVDVLTLFWDGTNYFANIGLAYS